MFNLRVYGLLLHENKILVCKENVRGRNILKFPGGGLEFGEGIEDCLRREFREELETEIADIRHFYTTDFFVQSFINPTHQVISIYYFVQADIEKLNLKKEPGLHFSWRSMNTLTTEDFELPIDKKVVGMLIRQMR